MRTAEDALIAGSERTVTGLSLKLVDLGILAVVFLAPLFMGGRGPIGKFVFVSIVCLTAVAWAVGQCHLTNGRWQRSGVEWLLLASIALVVLQLIPLPESILARISPSIHELLPLWSSDGSATVRLGEWSTVSLTPEATRGALVVLLGYILLFLLIVQRIRSLEDVARLLRWVAIGAIAMAVVGLLQFLLGNGKFLWIYEHPSRDTFHAVKGTFHNQNHFAQCLALGIGPLIFAWAKAPAKSLQKHLFGVGLGLVLVAGLLTFSRGGVIVIAVACMATVAIFVWKSLLDKKALVVAGVMGAIVIAALLIHGYEPLSVRFAALQQSRSLAEASEARAALWSALLDGIPRFARLGSGIGSHRDVYPLFMEEHYDIEFTHGENGYLPLALEGGIPALLLMLTGIGICFWWCVRTLAFQSPEDVDEAASLSRRPARSTRGAPEHKERLSISVCAGAVLPGLLASVLHSLGDFVWYISSCMSITVILAACVCRLYQMVPRSLAENRASGPSVPAPADLGYRVGFSQPAWIGIAVILVMAGTWMIHDRHKSALAAPHRYAYERIALPAYARAMPEESREREMLFEMASHLKKALQQNPDDPRTNLQFSAACLRQFELDQRHATNPMALQQIREAALASQFPSKETQDAWLKLAVGENMKLLDLALKHCRRALRIGPLQGNGYVYLAELSFLEGPNTAAKEDYIQQAYRVRPHSGVVAFAIGKERALAGDMDGALKFWRGAFHQDPQIRSLIIEQVAANVPGEFFLENFQPEPDALRELKRTYQRVGQTADARLMARRLVEKLVEQVKTADQKDAGKIWFDLQGMYVFLEDSPAALQCARRAVEFDADNVAYRRRLGILLLEDEDYAAAAQELQWCMRRKPNDKTLLQQLTAARRGSLKQRSATSPAAAQDGQRF